MFSLRTVLGVAAVASVMATGARADILLSVGYYDLAPGHGNSNPLPNPWINSPNTTFLGDASVATSGDPDEAALLLTNTGTTPYTLDQEFTVTAGTTNFTLWDSLIGASGFVIAPGENVILSSTTSGDNFDGSDIGLLNSTVTFALNGTTYQATDSGSILHGSPNGSANETEPWTQIDDLFHSSNATPEPASAVLVGGALAMVAFQLRRRRQ